MYKTVDLCAGIGGIRKGFELTKHYKNIKSAEIDEYAAKTYSYNFNGDDPRNDLTSEEFKNALKEEPFDVLMAGFPCQPFSSQGKQAGFDDPTKGTIFFHLKEIISQNRPKVIFLENVQNIVSHKKGYTIQVIIETLERELGYKVVGVREDKNGNYIYNHSSFVRNTKNFGLPQNRPRAYFIAFDKKLYGNLLNDIRILDSLPEHLPERLMNNDNLNKNLEDIIEKSTDISFYMSKSYLDTLKRHRIRQKEKGNGFGFCILNENGVMRENANTILATGGSGKERNLIIQKMPPHSKEDLEKLRKKGGVNDENVRIMTPDEWGRLQGFIGYAFLDKEGNEKFGFPEGMPIGQKYKQFGNSVSIPVIETMAEYIFGVLSELKSNPEVILKNYASNYSKEKGIIKVSEAEVALNCSYSQAEKILGKMVINGILSTNDNLGEDKFLFVD